MMFWQRHKCRSKRYDWKPGSNPSSRCPTWLQPKLPTVFCNLSCKWLLFRRGSCDGFAPISSTCFSLQFMSKKYSVYFQSKYLPVRISLALVFPCLHAYCTYMVLTQMTAPTTV